jgi:hypothetical protein
MDMVKVLWQGSGEQLWRIAEITSPAQYGDVYSLTLDFIWTDHDDVRRLQSCDHYGKLELRGEETELKRLGPLLVEFLNANRSPNQMLRVRQESLDPNKEGTG